MKETYKILKYLRLSIDDDGDGESNSIHYQRNLSSIFGIAIVALPAGIITAGYMGEIDKE